jgi:hypothetical protein
MGLKLMKFHVVTHMADDILNFGVPLGVDTGSNESHHKPTKTAAKQTQKNKKKFDQQTATRCQENLAVDMALSEIFSGHKTWEHTPTTIRRFFEDEDETDNDEDDKEDDDYTDPVEIEEDVEEEEPEAGDNEAGDPAIIVVVSKEETKFHLQSFWIGIPILPMQVAAHQRF